MDVASLVVKIGADVSSLEAGLSRAQGLVESAARSTAAVAREAGKAEVAAAREAAAAQEQFAAAIQRTQAQLLAMRGDSLGALRTAFPTVSDAELSQMAALKVEIDGVKRARTEEAAAARASAAEIATAGREAVASVRMEATALKEAEAEWTRFSASIEKSAAVSRTQMAKQAAARPTVTGTLTSAPVQKLADSALLAGGGIAAALGLATKQAADFDTAMADLNSSALLPKKALEELRQGILNIARDPSVLAGPKDLAKAMYEVVSVGYRGKEALEVEHQAARLAAAGMAGAAESAHMLISVLQSGIGGVHSAAQAVDVLAKTVHVGSFHISDLAAHFPQLIQLAKASGVTLQELGAAYAGLSRRGIDAGQASELLQQVIARLLKPSKEGQRIFNELGVSWGESGLKATGLTGILQQMAVAHAKNGDQMDRAMGRIQGLAGMLALTDNAGRSYVDVLKQIGAASEGVGAAQQSINAQMQGAGQQWKLLQKDVELLAVDVGEKLLPQFHGLVKGLDDLVNAFGRLSPATQSVLVKGAEFTAFFLLVAGGAAKALKSVTELAAGLKALGGVSAASGASGAAGATGAGAGASGGLIAGLGGGPLAAILAGGAAGGYGIYKEAQAGNPLALLPGVGYARAGRDLGLSMGMGESGGFADRFYKFVGLRNTALGHWAFGDRDRQPGAAAHSNSWEGQDASGTPQVDLHGGGGGGVPPAVHPAEVAKAVKAMKGLTEAQREYLAAGKETAKLEEELKALHGGHAKAAGDLEARYRLLPPAVRQHMQALRESVKTIEEHREAAEKHAAVLLKESEDYRGAVAETTARLRDLKMGEDSHALAILKIAERYPHATAAQRAYLDGLQQSIKREQEATQARERAAKVIEEQHVAALKKLKEQQEATARTISESWNSFNQQLGDAQVRLAELSGDPLARLRAQFHNLIPDSELKKLTEMESRLRGMTNALNLANAPKNELDKQITDALAGFAGTGKVETKETRDRKELLEALKRLSGGGYTVEAQNALGNLARSGASTEQLQRAEAQLKNAPLTAADQAARLQQLHGALSPDQLQLLGQVTGSPGAYFGQLGDAFKQQTDKTFGEFGAGLKVSISHFDGMIGDIRAAALAALSSGGAAGAGGDTHVHMTVVTPDAGSFVRSRSQVLSDYQRGLEYAAVRGGG